jgi:predicted RNA-binding Zn-ribbon protein involved in translation (DUF1610 family)
LSTVPFPDLYVDGDGPRTLHLDGGLLTVQGKKHELEGAVFETRKRFGNEMLVLGILLFLLAGIGVIFIILYYYVKVEVLVIITGEGGELSVRGEQEVLEDLHYRIQKHCLKKKRSKKDGAKGKKKDALKGEGVTALTCPQCGSDKLYYEAAFHTGRKYHCKRCDYIGAFVIEKTVSTKD